ncbi:c-type cytochrome [Sphingomonas quercus]|uniref:C-type cytochrome n=1 Tax=Sphingomonas quercus TaxID=2842451 RepID=A0ABS6BGX0_9SPHN|nr:cytochrome c [Sphingomonas quercus]MBU3077553.1 c-type cytochrome [Sphingomonas quercus]
MKRMYLMLGAAALALGGAAIVGAQMPERNVWGGAYTAEQAERGKAAYAENCAACHGETLSGIDVAPALVGSTFLSNWNNTSAADLFERIQMTMPLNAPGTLGGRTVADIEAFIFQSNGFPTGQLALPPTPQMMTNVRISAQKPGG